MNTNRNALIARAATAAAGVVFLTSLTFAAPAEPGSHTFSIGDRDFLLDNKPLQIRCGEIHLPRVPREYWRDRLKRCRAMGLNAVCAYLFWNFHEPAEGKFEWNGQADAAEFCRIAQEEGLWVVLRPGPYACAEWEMGGLPWWLLKHDDIKLRTTDPRFMAATRTWLAEVGRTLGSLQVTRGGPILMVQVENEYGFYGKDTSYMAGVKQALIDAGFTVPLFACNPPYALKNGTPEGLFQVVNFGKDPAGGFKALRDVQPTGPLMCGEFYPGWFDTWGSPHHRGDTPTYLADLDYMLSHGASFSLYMAHGGTTFGLWSGADRPFKPDTSSYDYDAPISENGATADKFRQTRTVLSKYLASGETLPDVPPDNPVISIPAFDLKQFTPVFDNLPQPITDKSPRNMEAYDQGRGCILYRTTLPAGNATTLSAAAIHDFAWVFVDGQPVGTMDRRTRRSKVNLPARKVDLRLDILVEAMGRVNFGPEVHDRKGLIGPVTFTGEQQQGGQTPQPTQWEVYPLPLDGPMLSSLKWADAPAGKTARPGFWRGTFPAPTAADTWLDLSNFGKGVIWINGHCLARYWNIGPTQTAYVPGPWLRTDSPNEVVVLDLLGPTKPTMAGLNQPILDHLRPELDFARQSARYGKFALDNAKPIVTGTFTQGSDAQTVNFPKPVEAKQFCLEARSSQDGKPFAAVAELDLLDESGNPIPHTTWTIAYADSEELTGEDGSASNAIDGQTANFWHTEWSAGKPPYPHRLVIDTGVPVRVAGLRYTPRQGRNPAGRIKDFAAYAGNELVRPQP